MIEDETSPSLPKGEECLPGSLCPQALPSFGGVGGGLVFLDQSEAAEKEEHRHTVVTEIREQMHGEQFVGIRQHKPKTVVVHLMIHIFVLLHNLADEVAIVVEHDGQDGDTTHRRTFSPCQ